MNKIILGCLVLAAFACGPRTEMSSTVRIYTTECDRTFAFAKTAQIARNRGIER